MQESDINKRIQKLRDQGMTITALNLDHDLAYLMKRIEDAEDFVERYWDHHDRPSMFHVKQAD